MMRTISALVLPRSVMIAPGLNAPCWARNWWMIVRTGAASTTMSAFATPLAKSVVADSTMPRASASRTVSSRRATPATCATLLFKANASDAPIKPRPTMQISDLGLSMLD
jgi:hypothetical protein